MPSTVVASFHYNEKQQILTVVFLSGMVYEYRRVPPQIYQSMKESTSKGIYLNTHIKGKFDFTKVE